MPYTSFPELPLKRILPENPHGPVCTGYEKMPLFGGFGDLKRPFGRVLKCLFFLGEFKGYDRSIGLTGIF